MKKKEIGRFAASVLVTAVGAATGLLMMVKSGKMIDEKNKRKSK